LPLSGLPSSMRCFVYKSLRRAETYVYLAQRDDFDRLPPALRDPLGALQFVMELDLSPPRRLAREDAEVVRGNLANHGVHVQFPPSVVLVPELGARDGDD
jgi:uncharacterized protein